MVRRIKAKLVLRLRAEGLTGRQHLTAELNQIVRELGQHQAAAESADSLITQALDLSEGLAQKYRQSPDHVRRLFNQLIFLQINPDPPIW